MTDTMIAEPSERTKSCSAPAHIGHILVAIDFSDRTLTALRYAGFMARQFGAVLTLVHVAEPYVYPEDLSAGVRLDEIDARWVALGKERLEQLKKTVADDIPVSVIVSTGSVWHGIVEQAKTLKVDLIITGTNGPTLKHTFIGSTAERVVRHAPCPVLVVPESWPS